MSSEPQPDAPVGGSAAADAPIDSPPLAPVTVSGSADLSTTAVTAGRSCAESPAFSVTALTASGATLASAPDAGCLAAGDEVLVINLQGGPGAIANVGNWELLRVASASGTSVTFAAHKTRSYGASAGSDSGIGTGATDQKVALVRVAQFGQLTIADGASVTTAPWDGLLGGVIAIRATHAEVDGSISVVGRGYRDGRWSQDDPSCTDNVTTEPGESIAGPAAASTSPNGGGPGGVAAASGISFIASAPLNSGASHATTGTMGVDHNGRSVGAPGATYGAADASKLTIGSGASGNLTCSDAHSGNPGLLVVNEQLAGGIVLLLTDELTVGASGTISASAGPSSRDVTAAGGYVFIRGGKLALGAGRVTAIGGSTTGQGVNATSTVAGGDGYVVVQGSSVTGTTAPAAHQL
ncbi:MAG: hypothetical protein JO257_13375 [Deltaproteobacteria bacterium]|nr:hypothetical protein [Deltaproteobacteria bacterium]